MSLIAEHEERTVLGMMMFSPETQDETARTLVAADFAMDSHRRIFTTILALRELDKPTDATSVTGEMGRVGTLEGVGAVGYAWSLTEDLPYASKPTAYLRVIREKSLLRSVIRICEGVIAHASEGDSADLVIGELLSKAYSIQAEGAQVDAKGIAEYVLPAWDQMKHDRAFAGEILGIPSGIERLDRTTTGWRDGELTYVGAHPGRGKTSFLLQAMHAAAIRGFGVGCISLEMRGVQLIKRLGVIQSRLTARSFRDPREMNAVDFQHAKNSLFALAELPIQICDESGLSPAKIAGLARKMHSAGAKVIFVDFVQIIHEDGKERREAINRVSASLRDTCKQLNIPFVVASQLARRDADPNRRPTMQDLRESGNLEQDCHNAMLLFRPKDKSSGDWTGEDEIIVDKQREGRTGVVPVTYSPDSLTFQPRMA